jgi:hypothetical protein
MKITAKPNADRRTKTRIKTHGLDKDCKILKGPMKIQVLEGDCVFVASDTWTGWLQVDMIKMED